MRLNPKSLPVCLVAAVVALSVGCGERKTTPIATGGTTSPRASAPTDQPKAPAPTVTLEVSPSSIDRGEQTTLSWSSTNAGSIVIDNGVGNVAENGSIVVSPLDSTTYSAVANGPGGQAQASARVTVVRPRTDLPVTSSDIDDLRKAIEDGRVKDIFFAYDKADLTAQSQETLKQNAIWLRRFPEAKVVVEGHCDERGTESYNLALGDRRALAVSDFLIKAGVDSSQLETISYGEERPFDPGHTESAWAKNRRAHFAVR